MVEGGCCLGRKELGNCDARLHVVGLEFNELQDAVKEKGEVSEGSER